MKKGKTIHDCLELVGSTIIRIANSCAWLVAVLIVVTLIQVVMYAIFIL